MGKIGDENHNCSSCLKPTRLAINKADKMRYCQGCKVNPLTGLEVVHVGKLSCMCTQLMT